MYYIYHVYILQDPSVAARMRANKYVALADIFPPPITGFAKLVVLKYYKSQISGNRVLETLRMQGQQVVSSLAQLTCAVTNADEC